MHHRLNAHPPARPLAPAAEPRPSDDNLLDATRALDRAALWPTRRIRTYLHSKQAAAASHR
jgi:hypothetical protein